MFGRQLTHHKPVHFEYSGTGPSGAKVTVYQAGTVAAINVEDLGTANETLAITDLFVNGDTAGTIEVFSGSSATVAAGKSIAKGEYAANGGLAKSFLTPAVLVKGDSLRVTGTGDVYVSGTGYLMKV